MKYRQIKWARQHDWFISSHGGVVWVKSIRPEGGIVPFIDYLKLRAWAGY